MGAEHLGRRAGNEVTGVELDSKITGKLSEGSGGQSMGSQWPPSSGKKEEGVGSCWWWSEAPLMVGAAVSTKIAATTAVALWFVCARFPVGWVAGGCEEKEDGGGRSEVMGQGGERGLHEVRGAQPLQNPSVWDSWPWGEYLEGRKGMMACRGEGM